MEGSREQLGGGYFLTLEKSKMSSFFKLENLQKMLKNQWKNYNFWKICKEILRVFEKFWKFYRNFRKNLGKNVENFENVDLWGARGALPSEASDTTIF